MKIFADLLIEYPELIDENYKDISISEVVEVLGYKFTDNVDYKFIKADDYKDMEILPVNDKPEVKSPAIVKEMPKPMIKKEIVDKPEPKKSEKVNYQISIDKKSERADGTVEKKNIDISTEKPINTELLEEIVRKIESKKNKLTDDAQDFISKKIKYLMEKENMKQDQAIAVAYSMAKKKGYKVPDKKVKSAEEVNVGTSVDKVYISFADGTTSQYTLGEPFVYSEEIVDEILIKDNKVTLTLAMDDNVTDDFTFEVGKNPEGGTDGEDVVTAISETDPRTVESSAKSKYKKIMEDKSEEELNKELEILKSKCVDSQLETETIKDKIKVLEKMLNKSKDEIKKDENEIKEEVKEEKKSDKSEKEDKERIDKLNEDPDEPSMQDLEAKYKTDEDIEKEFEGYTIDELEWDTKKEGNDWRSGKLVVSFPEGEEHVGGGSTQVVEYFMIDHRGRVLFDNWFPEKTGIQLRDFIKDNVDKNIKASVKIESADKKEIDKKESKKYYNLREYFDTDKKAEARIEALTKKGYNVVHYTRLTIIEGTERKYQWEIEAIPPTVISDDTKIEQEWTELPILKQPKVKASEEIKEEVIELNNGQKIEELNAKMNDLLSTFYQYDDSDEGKNVKASIKKELDIITKEIEVLSKTPEKKIEAGEKITAEPAVQTMLKDMGTSTNDSATNAPQQLAQPQSAEPVPAVKDEAVVEDKPADSKDVLDWTKGIELVDGLKVLKDEQSGELYVTDTEGKEQGYRIPLISVKEDAKLIKELFMKLMGLTEPVVDETATDVPASNDSIENKLEKIDEKLDTLLNPEKSVNKEEANKDETKQNEELAAIKKSLSDKGEQIKNIVNHLIDTNKIVISREDIRKFVASGESAIYARKKAKETKIKALNKKLWGMDSDTIKVIEDVFVNKSTEPIKGKKNISDFLMFLGD